MFIADDPNAHTYIDFAAARAATIPLGQRIHVQGGLLQGDNAVGSFEQLGPIADFPGVVDDAGYHLITADGNLLRRVGCLSVESYTGEGYDTAAEARASAIDNLPYLVAMEAARRDWGAKLCIDNIVPVSGTVTFAGKGHAVVMGDNGRLFLPAGHTGDGVYMPFTGVQTGEGQYHRIHVEKDYGAGVPNPAWLADNSYPQIATENSVGGTGLTFEEAIFADTDIGIRTDGLFYARVDFRAIGFSIGLVADTESRAHAWSEYKSNQVQTCRVAAYLKVRGDGTGVTNWANEIEFDLEATNSGTLAANRSTYGVVIGTDPALANPYVPTKLKISCSHETVGADNVQTNPATTVESVPLLVLRGQSIDWDGRIDTPNQVIRVWDRLSLPDNNIRPNSSIKLRPSQVFDWYNVDIANGNSITVEVPGRTRTQETLVEATPLHAILQPSGPDAYSSAHRNVGFGNYVESTLPEHSVWRLIAGFHRDNETFSTTRNLTFEDGGAPNAIARGGVGSWINLGDRRYGGNILMSVTAGDTWHLRAWCYDANDALVTTLGPHGWTLRSVGAAHGTNSWRWAAPGVGSMWTDGDATLAQRQVYVNENVASVFIMIYSDELYGFDIGTVDYPGCSVRAISEDTRFSNGEPGHGIHELPRLVLDQNPASTFGGYRNISSNITEAVADTWGPGITVAQAGNYQTASGEIWIPYSGPFAGGTGIGRTATCGTNSPDGQADPFTDSAGVTWRRWRTAAQALPVTSFSTLTL